MGWQTDRQVVAACPDQTGGYRLRWSTGGCLALLVIVVFGGPTPLQGQLDTNRLETVILTNGMRIPGRLGSLKQIDTTNVSVSRESQDHGIVLIADELRDVFVSRFNVASKTPLDRQEETFAIWQRVHKGDANNTAVGDILGIGPFDEYGRRMITTLTPRGPETVFQGITEINPRYVRLQGLINSDGPEEQWDMRVSLNSIRTDVLLNVLHLQIKDEEDANERLRLVDFFAQAGKYKLAEDELRSIRRSEKFPGLKEELEKRSEGLRGQIARQMLDEARQRLEAGQPEIAGQLIVPLLERTDLASAVLVDIREARREIEAGISGTEASRQQFLDLARRVVDGPDLEGDVKALASVYVEEIDNQLRISNQDRLATFARLADDPELSDVEKLSLAISGWIVGAARADQNMGTTQSMMKVRPLVIEYLQTSDAGRRVAILKELEQMEAGAVEYLDLILQHIPPPLAPSPNEIDTIRPMEFPIEFGNPPRPGSYLVQLPPEYDPWRRYPCILTLGGVDQSTTPEAQIDWWCGRSHPRLPLRTGLAPRHGYIVISPRWARPDQLAYEYSQREHAIVLKTLRDAMRRFSIDSDRVFLSGHFEGGTAAWDIGQSHPEHWAGVMPISARASKYINHTFANGSTQVPWYFVNGGRDFYSRDVNKTVWNKRMIRREYQTIIVLFRGRGTEKFSDEIPNLFRWMEPLRRQFPTRDFECSSLRPWNNYFWWFEVDLENHRNMVAPEQNWKSARRDDWAISGEVRENRPNSLKVRGAAGDATVWLSPAIVDFSRDIEIDSTGRNFDGEVVPSRKTILEDARTRGDRQYAWWAKVVLRNKNWVVEE